jgi:DNA-binding MarR family transcriptional regulator
VDQQEITTLGYLIHDVARLLKRRFAESTRRHGLTMPQWRVLAQLKRTGELSQVALANLVESDPMTVSRIVERLEAAGLVSRLADPQDSRAKLVRLTNAARNLFEEIRPSGLAVYKEALKGVSVTERNALVAVLNKIHGNLSVEIAPQNEEELS